MDRAELPLRPDETLIREDLVCVYGTSVGGFWPEIARSGSFSFEPRSAKMVITTQRVAFLPPGAPERPFLVDWIRARFVSPHKPPPLRRVRSFDLRHIGRLHSWHPPFSGPPMFESGRQAVYFLLGPSTDVKTGAAKDAMREHFEAVEAAWRAVNEVPPTGTGA